MGVDGSVETIKVIPEDAVWPKKSVMLILGTALGLTIGFLFALVSLRKRRKHEVVEL